MIIHIIIIRMAYYHFLGFPSFHKSSDSFRSLSSTLFGINLIVKATSIGNSITSSKYPGIGMKSGIKSMGESAYATVMPARL